MTASEKATQTKVGFFVLLGLAAVCSMVVYFGRFGEALKQYYYFRVEFPDASGLFNGADVVLAGAKVGAVAEGPNVLQDMKGVWISVKIRDDVHVPDSAIVSIGSAGLLGDSFVNITMPRDFEPTKAVPIKPGATIVGKKESGFADLQEQGGLMIADARKALDNISAVLNRINSEILTPKTVKDMELTLANLRTTTQQFADSSKKLDSVLADASAAVKDASEAIKNSSKTLAKAGPAMDSAKGAADELKKTMVDARFLIQQARTGKGSLGMLLSDQQVAQNLRSLVENLRERGILWYRDAPGKPSSPTRR